MLIYTILLFILFHFSHFSYYTIFKFLICHILHIIVFHNQELSTAPSCDLLLRLYFYYSIKILFYMLLISWCFSTLSMSTGNILILFFLIIIPIFLSSVFYLPALKENILIETKLIEIYNQK